MGNHDDHEHYREENENDSASNTGKSYQKKKISPWVGLVVFSMVILLIMVILGCDFGIRKRCRQETKNKEEDDGGKKKKNKNVRIIINNDKIDDNDTSESENEIDENENENK